MKNWLRKHKILTGVVLTLLVLLTAAFLFVWSKLSMIQYVEPGKKPSVTESVTDTEAPPETEPDTAVSPDVSPDVSQEETENPEKPPVEEASETGAPHPEQPAPPDETEPDDPEQPENPELVPDTPPVLPEDLPGADRVEGVVDEKDVLNIMILGTDERSLEFSDEARSDSMILLSLNKKAKTIKLVSLERGMGVPILEGPHQGQYDWLTHVFRYGGAELLLRTVRECFDVDVDRYVRLNFNAVMKVVDALGGVEIDLSEIEAVYVSCSNDPMGNPCDDVEPGLQLLDGGQAVAYARLREPDSDWQRVQRQRKVVIQCIEKVRGASLLELNKLADEVLPLVQTSLSKMEIARLLLLVPRFIDASIEQMTIPTKGTYGSMTGMGGRSLFAVDFDTNSRTLHDFLYGTEKDTSAEK